MEHLREMEVAYGTREAFCHFILSDLSAYDERLDAGGLAKQRECFVRILAGVPFSQIHGV